MADRSQHLEQIMENQTRFNLNAAIQNWQQELAAQSYLTPEVRRELETHLRDSITELRQLGLNEDESFWLARRRVGQPKQLGEEFAKADPAKVWRERVFWMAISLVGSYVFVTWKDLLASWLNESIWLKFFYLIPLLVLIGSVVVVRRGLIPNTSGLENMASWKLGCGLFAILTVTVLTAYFSTRNLPASDALHIGYMIGMIMSWFNNAVWPAVIVLILLFTLKRNRKTPKQTQLQ